MTMLSFPTDEPEVDPDRPGQWRLAQIELVNWGTFAGHVAVDIARTGHLFTGRIRIGQVVAARRDRRRSHPRSVAAPQRGSSGRRFPAERSDADELCAWGVEQGSGRNRRPGDARPTFARRRPGAASCCGTRTSATNRSSCCGCFTRPARAPNRRALKDARIFARGHVELLEVKPHVEGGIDARRMSKAFPDALITTGGRHGRFHERVVRQFGFRGDATLQLLHKTQSAKNLGTLDALFRGFMLDQPGTFARAETAVEQFTSSMPRTSTWSTCESRLTRSARSMRQSRRSTWPVPRWRRSRTLHDAVEPFTATLKLRLAREAVGPARAALARAESELSDAAREQRLAAEALETAKARVRDEGGARVELLQERIDSCAARRGHRRTGTEPQLAAELARIGAPMPDDADAVRGAARGCGRPRRRATSPRCDMTCATPPVRHARRWTILTKQIQALRDHRSNLDEKLLRARRFLAEASACRTQRSRSPAN